MSGSLFLRITKCLGQHATCLYLFTYVMSPTCLLCTPLQIKLRHRNELSEELYNVSQFLLNSPIILNSVFPRVYYVFNDCATEDQ